MKRMVLLVLMGVIVTLGVAAQWSAGITGGVNYIIGSEYDVDGGKRLGFPVFAEVGYDIELGLANPTVGAKVGFINNLFGADYEETIFGETFKTESSSRSIPVIGFLRYPFGLFFVEAGLGVHLWTVEAEATSPLTGTVSADDNGVGYYSSFTGGVEIGVADTISVRGGPVVTILGFDSGSDTFIGATVGASFGF